MVRRTRALLGIFSFVMGAVTLPVVVRPADAAEAPSTVDGLIAFSIGVQVPPFGEDLAVPSDIWTVRPDGTDETELATGIVYATAWRAATPS